MASILSLPSDIHIEVFKFLKTRRSLLAINLSCKQLHDSFSKAHLGTLLERIRFNKIGCGIYAEALMASFRLMEPDIDVEHVRSFAAAFREKRWARFLECVAPLKPLEQHKLTAVNGYYSQTSFCFYNRDESHSILHDDHTEPIPFSSRWRRNYRLVRLLANQCCITRLRQGLGEDIDDYSRLSLAVEHSPPPTQSELERFERGVYVLWITVNIASLTHRPDFLVKAGKDLTEQAAVQRELRRAVLSAFNVWDWRNALSIRDYMIARLGHLDLRFQTIRTETWKEPCMWEGLPDAELPRRNEDEISDAVMAAFSPPGALRFFFPDRLFLGDSGISGQLLSGEMQRDLAHLKVRVESCAGLPKSSECELIKGSVRGFADMEPFFWRIDVLEPEALLPWRDIETFYPPDEYPDRNKLPLEVPRSIVPRDKKAFYGPKGQTSCMMGSDGLGNNDTGWAWIYCADWSRCVWDDWRLEKYINYHKPKRRKLLS